MNILQTLLFSIKNGPKIINCLHDITFIKEDQKFFTYLYFIWKMNDVFTRFVAFQLPRADFSMHAASSEVSSVNSSSGRILLRTWSLMKRWNLVMPKAFQTILAITTSSFTVNVNSSSKFIQSIAERSRYFTMNLFFILSFNATLTQILYVLLHT